MLLARGKMTNPVWSPDGQALLFLREVTRTSGVASEIHSVNPEVPTERRVAATSQFAAFSPNANASVFVGASRSKAQPTVLLLVASVQREFTLCEHRASHPAEVSPVFSPDSKRVYFQSDHEGKSALYSVNVESLVESTSGNDS
jgi:oligogalacturonide lyase